jgi:hypothetical protein
MDTPTDGPDSPRGDSPVSPNALNELVSGIEEHMGTAEEPVWLVYGPRWAQDEGADPPPDGLDSPVWAPETGWMEKVDAPVGDDVDGPLALYAPDSIDPETAAPDQ